MARIAIAGAGIGGLATAAGLARAGHAVRIFDRWAAPQPVGSGLVVQPVGLSVLDALGAGDAARKLGQTISRMAGHDAKSGKPVLDVTYDPAGRGREGLAIHRAALHGVLLKAAQDAGANLELGAPVTAARDGAVHVRGAWTDRFDLVVDAAGAGSLLSPLRARPLPYGAIWGNVTWPADTDLPSDELRQRYCRAERMLGVLPIGRQTPDGPRQAAIFWSLPRDGIDAWRARPLAHWKDEAETLWPEIAPFLAQITDHDQMTPARYSHGTLRRPWSERLVHLGDAAHRASPQLGQGANMALLDATALVAAVETGPMTEVGARMWNARRLHVSAYQALSALFTPQYQSDSRILPLMRNHVLMPLSRTWPARTILPALVRGHVLPPVLAGL
ncbi:MAG: NAD(P)/FAD-dependent oxidoreductase [Pseudomonadota bacterium]